jgi:DNA-binding NarL/FixJ family response regulator
MTSAASETPVTPEPIRVLLVDDDPLVRAGLRLMLGGASDLEVVADVSDGDEVLDAVRTFSPDVVLMDVRMTRLDGISAVRVLRGSGLPTVPAVIVLTTFRADVTVLDAIRAGASGFLLKHTPPGEILTAIRAAAVGQPTVSPDVLRQLIDHVAALEPAAVPGEVNPLAALTQREREVALAVAEGLSNTEIAERLFLSHGSVKAHISNALAKLSLDNRIQLAVLAHESQR